MDWRNIKKSALAGAIGGGLTGGAFGAAGSFNGIKPSELRAALDPAVMRTWSFNSSSFGNVVVEVVDIYDGLPF